jgi:PAS domain S-box-containing protein
MTATDDAATLLKTLLEDATGYAFVTLDARGVIERWSRGAELLFGQTAADVIGSHVSVIFTIEDVRADVPQQELRAAAAGEGSVGHARWHVRADGTRFLANDVMTAIKDASGDVCGFVKVAFDATEQKRAADERERRLVHEQQLNRDKDTFFAAVSHELRTPLTAVSGWVALLERAADDPATVREGLANMKHSVDMMATLVSDLLDTARARAAKMQIVPKRVELGPIVLAAVQAFRQQWEAKQVFVDHDIPDGLTVIGDPTRLHQVVWNLITNAIKHTPAGGEIDIAVRGEDGQGVIEIRDSGDGIDPVFLPHIFEPFRQHERDGEGLGLGLAIARALVDAHGGTITAQSDGSGRGATFRVRLPLA